MIEAKVTYVDGLQFVGEAASGHAIVMDGDKEVGGREYRRQTDGTASDRAWRMFGHGCCLYIEEEKTGNKWG